MVVAIALTVVAVMTVGAQDQKAADVKQRDKLEQSQRQEGQAILDIADAALAGKPVPADFQIRWQNEFLKARQGTFVPFTLTVDVSKLGALSALMYVRAVPREGADCTDQAAQEPESERQDAGRDAGGSVSGRCHFSGRVEAGLWRHRPDQQRVFGCPRRLRHLYRRQGSDQRRTRRPDRRRGARRSGPASSSSRSSVPNFWSGELTTSR